VKILLEINKNSIKEYSLSRVGRQVISTEIPKRIPNSEHEKH
jgi:hypothetical protein